MGQHQSSLSMPRFNKTQQFAAFLFIALILIAAVMLGLRSSRLPSPMSMLPLSVATISPAPDLKPNRAPVKTTLAPLSVQDFDRSWKRFQEVFGEGFDATFTDDRRLSHVRAGEGSSIGALNYKRGNKEAALKRAEEVLHEAGSLIRIDPVLPLVARDVLSDEISSKVEFAQTYKNVPIEPFGKVTVQLDEAGGLRGLYSNYISDPVITNEPTQDPSVLKDSLLSQVHFTPDHPDQVSTGTLILFAPGPQDSESKVPLTYAYRFFVDGREVVVDASNGKILSEKDRRQF
jgi:hypothetical protein